MEDISEAKSQTNIDKLHKNIAVKLSISYIAPRNVNDANLLLIPGLFCITYLFVAQSS